ncbi:unnamed protein product [Timema podura]|uniref:Nuclear protein MDM1 n=1 Tax=Timema podura TaxID=61482 RepID=A0ABN7NKF6_TIMPD|nr:unnamed protein product [Timema podura]
MANYSTTAPPAGPISNAITRINTEYRLQFAWPKGDQGRPPRSEDVQDGGAGGPPRKSLSMGALRPSGTLVPVHKKPVLDIDRGDEGGSELEPLVRPDIENGPLGIELGELYGEEKIQDEMSSKGEKSRRRKEFKTEYKKKFRPFSQYDYVEGKFQKKKESESVSLPFAFAELPQGDSWYREVLELRRKAGEYKYNIDPPHCEVVALSPTLILPIEQAGHFSHKNSIDQWRMRNIILGVLAWILLTAELDHFLPH